MRILPLLLMFCSLLSRAQQDSVRTISMNEVEVAAGGYKATAQKKVRTQHVYFWLTPTGTKQAVFSDSVYFVTKFSSIDTVPVWLHSAGLRLRAYDTAKFDVKLFVLQISGDDTSYHIVVLDGTKIKHNRMTVSLKDERIVLKPDPFYIGYGIRTKHLDKKYPYRIYSTSEGGEGALVTLFGNKVKVSQAERFPYIFPFVLSYKALN